MIDIKISSSRWLLVFGLFVSTAAGCGGGTTKAAADLEDEPTTPRHTAHRPARTAI